MKKIFRNGLLLVSAVVFLSPNIEASVNYSSSVPVSTSVPVSDNSSVPSEPVSVKAALEEFRNLSRKERKARIKEVKQTLKEYKKERRAGNAPSTNQTLLIILAILLPPLAVYLHEGVVNNKFWISLLLTLLFFLPGVIYALVVVLDKDK